MSVLIVRAAYRLVPYAKGYYVRHSVSRSEAFKVANWLQGKWPHIEAKKMGRDDVAKLASEDLGLVVTGHIVNSIARDLGKKFPIQRGYGTTRKSYSNSRVRAVARVVRSVIENHNELCRSMGEPDMCIPTEMLELVISVACGRDEKHFGESGK